MLLASIIKTGYFLILENLRRMDDNVRILTKDNVDN